MRGGFTSGSIQQLPAVLVRFENEVELSREGLINSKFQTATSSNSQCFEVGLIETGINHDIPLCAAPFSEKSKWKSPGVFIRGRQSKSDPAG